MDMRPPRQPAARHGVGAVASAAIVAIGLVVGACGPAVTNPTPSRPAASATTDPSAVAEAMLLAPWRPAPLIVDDNLVAAIKFTCTNPADPDLMAAMADVPVALVDARGAGLASAILADDNVAFECRVKLEPVGGILGATIIEPPSRLVPDATVPVEDVGIKVISHSRVDEDTGSRTILIGRVGPKAYSADIGFNDETWVYASKANGWFMAWWPGKKVPGGIVSSDNKNVVVASAPSPATEIEGRVGPAAWWVDPAAPPVSPKTKTIPALIRERACASGHSPEGRVLEPVVFSSEGAVLVTVWVRRAAGAQDCQGNPESPLEITLPEPLGARKLLDGSTIPPRDATVPAE